VLGTEFQGRLIGQTRVGDRDAILPEITGRAFITGIRQFVMDDKDPLHDGFCP
jgi:proline racemase